MPRKTAPKATESTPDDVSTVDQAPDPNAAGRVLRTITEAAGILGVNPRTLAGWLARGCPGAKGAYDVEAIRQWREQTMRTSAADGAPVTVRGYWATRKLRAQSLAAEIHAAHADGELVDAKLCQLRILQAIGLAVRQFGDELPYLFRFLGIEGETARGRYFEVAGRLGREMLSRIRARCQSLPEQAALDADSDGLQSDAEIAPPPESTAAPGSRIHWDERKVKADALAAERELENARRSLGRLSLYVALGEAMLQVLREESAKLPRAILRTLRLPKGRKARLLTKLNDWTERQVRMFARGVGELKTIPSEERQLAEQQATRLRKGKGQDE